MGGGAGMRGRQSWGPWTEAPPGKWEQHEATEMAPHRKAPAGQGFSPDSLQGSLWPYCHHSHTSEPPTPIKHLLGG